MASDPIRVVEVTGTACERRATARKGASEVRVRVCENGNGPAVDVRRFVTSPASGQVTRGASTFTGATREGLWLQPSEAFALAELLVTAAMAAESMEGDEAA